MSSTTSLPRTFASEVDTLAPEISRYIYQSVLGCTPERPDVAMIRRSSQLSVLYPQVDSLTDAFFSIFAETTFDLTLLDARETVEFLATLPECLRSHVRKITMSFAVGDDFVHDVGDFAGRNLKAGLHLTELRMLVIMPCNGVSTEHDLRDVVLPVLSFAVMCRDNWAKLYFADEVKLAFNIPLRHPGTYVDHRATFELSPTLKPDDPEALVGRLMYRYVSLDRPMVPESNGVAEKEPFSSPEYIYRMRVPGTLFSNADESMEEGDEEYPESDWDSEASSEIVKVQDIQDIVDADDDVSMEEGDEEYFTEDDPLEPVEEYDSQPNSSDTDEDDDDEEDEEAEEADTNHKTPSDQDADDEIADHDGDAEDSETDDQEPDLTDTTIGFNDTPRKSISSNSTRTTNPLLPARLIILSNPARQAAPHGVEATWARYARAGDRGGLLGRTFRG